MKKAALVIALCLLFAIVAGVAAQTDDEEFRAGLKYYNSRNYKAAIKHFRAYAGKHPDPATYYLIGYSLYELGRFSEAEEYFREAFFIDPEFSLEKIGLIRKESVETTDKTPVPEKQIFIASEETTRAQSADEQPGNEAKELPPVPLSSPGSVQPLTKPSEPPATTATAPGVTEQGQHAAPLESPGPPAPMVPVMPDLQRHIPPQGAGALVGIFAALGVFMVLISLVFYLYFCLCLFLIAKKLNVEAPWTAWIPLVQIWTIVVSAGKPWWWIILLFVPLVNFFVGIYLWMCISENLGRNKWLGLLMIVPLANMIYLGVLAFSKSESTQGFGTGVTLPE